MTNIPTDLLRTLIAVVDLRSFTKAAAKLGVTQPAVSAQIKRLQFMLGGDLLDRSVQGISLTARGETVVNHARRLLSINDQIVHLGTARHSGLAIRVGTSSEYVASVLPGVLARYRTRFEDAQFIVRTDDFDELARDLRSGALDVFVGVSLTAAAEARHGQEKEVVWTRAATTRLDFRQAVPLVSYGERCVYHRLATTALKAAGLAWENVFTASSITCLEGAISAGLGIMAMTRRRAEAAGLTVWEDAPLPILPHLYSGIFVREGRARAAYEQLADDIAAVIYFPDHQTTAIEATSAA